MSKLFSYCLRYDFGSAPNPYFGLCTLVICKPVIRRAAEKGDWIVGFGSTQSPQGDLSNSIIYAMKVTDKMTMQAYDTFCQTQYPKKIPDLVSTDYRRWVGDCIYDFSRGIPPLVPRPSVHGPENRDSDLKGEHALISSHFYYFGDNPVKLCDSLRPIIHKGQGFKSHKNDPFFDKFSKWLSGLGYKTNRLYGEPLNKPLLKLGPNCKGFCSQIDKEQSEKDEEFAKKCI